MEDKIKINPSVEGIPEEVKKVFTDKYTSHELDKDWKKVYDEKGDPIYKVDTKAIKQAIKAWATSFTNKDISVEDIDFDEYHLEGYTIDEAPKNCLTLVRIDRGFYVRDKRKDSNCKLWLICGPEKMFRDRDNRFVQVEKIPDSQLLGKADDLWVIPEEVLVSHPRKLRDERYQAKKGSIDRWDGNPNTDPLKYTWSLASRSGSYMDKSGYLVNKAVIDKKLSEFKENKLKNSTFSNLLEIYKKGLLAETDKLNSMITEGLNSISLIVNKAQDWPYEVSNFLNYVKDLKKDLIGLADNPVRWAEKYSEAEKNNDIEGLKNLTDRVRELVSERSYQLQISYNYDSAKFNEALDKIRELVDEIKKENQIEAKGQSTSSNLQATEGYYVSRDLLAAFEEI